MPMESVGGFYRRDFPSEPEPEPTVGPMAGRAPLHRPPCRLLFSSLAASAVVLLSHLALASIPRLLSISLLAMLPVSALVLVAVALLSRWVRRMLGISAPALAVVVFNILFIWGVYVALVREGSLSLLGAVVNGGCPLLLYGLYRIHFGDPGFVACDNSFSILEERVVCEAELQFKNSSLPERVRTCKTCRASVRGFDHHCPAFGSCIVITKFMDAHKLGYEVVFLIWHIYCICINVKTDEWINWRMYPEFQHSIQPQPGQSFFETRFINPYSKGIVGNIKEFLKTKE